MIIETHMFNYKLHQHVAVHIRTHRMLNKKKQNCDKKTDTINQILIENTSLSISNWLYKQSITSRYRTGTMYNIN